MRKNFEKNSRDNNTEWGTPWDTFYAIQERVHIKCTLDVCATQKNAKCDKWYDRRNNGLAKSWQRQNCWLNPPYGKEIYFWLERAVYESHRGANVVCLIPSRTDPVWWHNLVLPYAFQVFFVKGRIRFQGASDGAMFPSAVVVYRPRRLWYCGPKFSGLEIPLK